MQTAYGNSVPVAPFRSGGWRVDPARCALERADEVLHLEPKVMDVLVYLARRAKQVVSKDDLIRDVWGGRFVTEDVITVSIHELRKAMGDSARQPEFIETIPRRGYRWIAPVEEISAPSQAAQAEGRQRVWLRVAAGAVLVLVLAGAWAWLRPVGRATASDRAASVQAAYQKGRYFLNKKTIAGLEKALSYFEEAVRLDARSAEAHAGIALAAVHLADAGASEREAMEDRARAEARQALALNPKLAEAHAALGMIHLVFDWNYSAAEKDFLRALEQNPNVMEAHQGYSWLLSAVGRHPEAILEAQRAVSLDSASPARYNELAWTLSYSGRYREGVAEAEKALELEPKDFQSYVTKGMMLELMGNTPAAYAAIRQGYLNQPGSERTVQRLDATYREEGLRGIYREWLRLMKNGSAPAVRHNNVWLASLYSRIGEVDAAIAALERAFEEREGGLAWLRVNPSFMPLRYDARYQSLVQRVGLADEPTPVAAVKP